MMQEIYGTIENETLYGTANSDILYGGNADPSYTNVLAAIRNNGGESAGYVYSNYGSRTLLEVEQDIAFMKSVYPDMDYVFVDQTSSKSVHLSYYSAIADYAHTLGIKVIFNVGTTPENSGFYDVADIVVVSEKAEDASTDIQDAVQAGIDSSKIASLSYAVNTLNVVETTRSNFLNGSGYTYVTEDGNNNSDPWDTLSVHFNEEVTLAQQLGGKILLPLYLYPSTTATVWDTVSAAGASCITIFNPANGPLSGDDVIHALSGDDTVYGYEGKDILYGETGNDTLYGGSGNDILRGGSGNDRLYGGSGNDTMYGGSGNDSYYVDDLKDRVFETSLPSSTVDLGGVDTVYTTVSYTLGAFVENLVIRTGANVSGTGNTLDNLIVSGRGNNVLDGGDGTDTLSYATAISGISVSLSVTTAQITGGSGNDTLLGFENIIGSRYNDQLIGDNHANLIFGNSGNDTLSGGAGDDRLQGGEGKDIEYGGVGNDTIFGNNGDDILYGGDGNDILYGGNGNDRLYGGEGKDTFVFNTRPDTLSNSDTILLFDLSNDTICLDHAVFKQLDTSTYDVLTHQIIPDHFVKNSSGTAQDNNDFILYDTDTGKLYYDPDGNGSTSAIEIAVLGEAVHPSLNYTNILIL